MGRWLEARAKKQTGAVIKALMKLQAKADGFRQRPRSAWVMAMRSAWASSPWSPGVWITKWK